MERPSPINWTSPFPCLDCWEVFCFLNFIQIFIEHSVANRENPDQTPRTAASDQGFHGSVNKFETVILFR